MTILFTEPSFVPVSGNSVVYPGAKLFFYETGTSNLQNTYSEYTLTTAHANPVIADADGRFAPIYLDPSLEDYKVVLKDSSDVTIWTVDPYSAINNTTRLGTMSDLLSASTALGTVSINGYHTAGDGGGGVFYWDASQDKANHNGGTIIDPDITFPSDWTNQTQVTAWFTDGTGTGCWVRLTGGELNAKWFGAKGDGTTNDTLSFTSAILTSSSIFIPSGTFLVSGITSSSPVNITGESVEDTIVKNYTDGASIFTFNQTGVSDKERRNWLYISNLTLQDTAAGTGTGVTFTEISGGVQSTLCIQLDKLYLRDFTAGLGLLIYDTIWASLLDINTDESEIRLISNQTPHFNNAVYIRGGEYRNPANSKSCLHIENADVVAINNLTAEGNSGGTTYVSGIYLKGVQQASLTAIYTEVLQQATQGAIVLDGCESVIIESALLNSQDAAVPSLKAIGGTKTISVKNSRVATGPIDVSSACGNIHFDGCHFDCKFDIAGGVNFTVKNSGPTTATCIPVIPNLQKQDVFSSESFKNWYDDSSFESGNMTITQQAGTPVASQDTSNGYYDTYSTKIVGVLGDIARTESLGTTDSTSDRVCVSFMAKATTEQDFDFIIYANGSRGSSDATITTGWRRYFIFGTDADCGSAGAGIFLDITFNGTNDLYIDDVQTISYTSYAKMAELIDKFRYVPTNGTRVTAATNEVIVPGIPKFDQGVRLQQRTVAPASPVDGGVYYADGTSWNPGSGKGIYFYDGSTYAKL